MDEEQLNAAYRKGQEDMRRRLSKRWARWRTNGVGGFHKAMRPDRKGYSDVPVLIRAFPVRDLPHD